MGYRSKPAKRSGAPVSRRQFGAASGLAVVGTGLVGMALLNEPGKTLATFGEMVSMGNSANPTKAFFVRPESGKHPGVVSWRESETMTESEQDKARELAAKGYAVLVVDRHSGDAPAVQSDAFLATWWLKQQQQVNLKEGIGTPDWALRRLEPVRRV